MNFHLFPNVFLFFFYCAISTNLCAECKQEDTVTIAAVGDLLLHTALQKKAAKSGYASLWEQVTPFIKAADIAYANLEGPIATGIDKKGQKSKDHLKFDFSVYTGYPRFNYHPSLAEDLVESGFDIVSTANNHSLDRGPEGIDITIDELEKVKLKFSGTKKKNEKGSWVAYTKAKDLTIAWLSCAEHTNGIEDRYGQVLHCYKGEDNTTIIKTIEELKDVVDAVIVAPHFGEEYKRTPNRNQIAFAKRALEAGATAVLGSHPHVLQPVENYLTKDGRNTLIAYSLGNFVSRQSSLDKRTSLVLLFDLQKGNKVTHLNNVRFLPLLMKNRSTIDDIHLDVLETPTEDTAAFTSITRSISADLAVHSLDAQRSCKSANMPIDQQMPLQKETLPALAR